MKIQTQLLSDSYNTYFDGISLQLEYYSGDKVYLKLSDEDREVSVSLSELFTTLRILKEIKE